MYNVGQKVTIKDRESILSTLGEECATFIRGPEGTNWNDSGMSEFCGRSATITEKKYDSYIGATIYSFKEFPNEWVFEKAWLEPYIKPVKLPEELFKI